MAKYEKVKIADLEDWERDEMIRRPREQRAKYEKRRETLDSKDASA